MRTYIPGLITIINHICRYLLAHDAKLRAAMSTYPETLTAYNAVHTACDALRVALAVFEVPG